MADFKDIKDEFKLIAEAQTGIGSFEYDRRTNLSAYRTNTVPLFLLFKQPSVNFPTRTNKYKTYVVQFGIYTTWNENERVAGTDYEDKQATLENLSEQFIRELHDRSLGMTAESTTVQDWTVEQAVAGTFQESIGVDGLVGLETQVTLRVFSDCDKGTFNY
jgi:hypothetical protein